MRQGSSNKSLDGKSIAQHAQLENGATQLLQSAALRMGWSARTTQRIVRVARTIADLDSSIATLSHHVAEAMQYRRQPAGAGQGVAFPSGAFPSGALTSSLSTTPAWRK